MDCSLRGKSSWSVRSQKTIYWICFRKVPHANREHALSAIDATYAGQRLDSAPERPLEPYLCQIGRHFGLPAHWHVGHAPERFALTRCASALRWLWDGGELSPRYRYELDQMEQKCEHMEHGCSV